MWKLKVLIIVVKELASGVIMIQLKYIVPHLSDIRPAILTSRREHRIWCHVQLLTLENLIEFRVTLFSLWCRGRAFRSILPSILNKANPATIVTQWLCL